MALDATDLSHLRRCVELAREALDDGDEPFGSVLVDGEGRVLREDRNRTKDGDQTRHPEFELARWAATHTDPADRSGCTVYTSGEHCAMCSAAHAWSVSDASRMPSPPTNSSAGSASGASGRRPSSPCRSSRSLPVCGSTARHPSSRPR
ncbi:hypothetical protein N798_03170 [Knoellia flava TL1]|uniref:CMP/dCMP-type deaminase domain-containing protein n=2 Tax=Knoellia flava TaxID=913969 RepID=A0A8H9FT49_9MICO|nr:nucleoside deaminase [Knoellia flava]KGN35336.1 hypothetical protein N798_03170 [Knoellia flava TL1]GGB78259.1 hypothetical protein GCM10011314_17420 [Knoellia flava]